MAKPRPIRQQLVDAFGVAKERDGLTYESLLKKSGLRMSMPNLHKKLNGKLGLRDLEIEALARALRIEVVTGSRRGAA